MSMLFCIADDPLHVPPVKIIFAVPVGPLLDVIPTQLIVSFVVQLIVKAVAPPQVSTPPIVQFPDNVFVVLVPVNDTPFGNVLPPLVIVLVAEIVSPELPAHECAVLSVKLPAMVRTALSVTVWV